MQQNTELPPVCGDADELPRIPSYWQKEIPRSYLRMPPEEMHGRIAKAKAQLGDSLIILGHHYQRDEIIRYADITGDSFKLAREASLRTQARYVVFCGVHFMAESADILGGPERIVILPNLTAGCSMADMASISDVEDCWAELKECSARSGNEFKLIPITYMNSAASLKAFCGEKGGMVCTSSNARKALEWGFTQGDKLLFFPDQHLGRNTGMKMGIPLDRMILWDPEEPLGGNSIEKVLDARLILWKGHCSVHQRFTVDQITAARARHPEVRVIVHPECALEVVQAADEMGSTEQIVKRITESAPGTQWAVGTEVNLVNRIRNQQPDKVIFCLDPIVCPCSTMYRIHPAYLLWVLEGLLEGLEINRIRVSQDIAHWARAALERMLALT
ncbi:MAG: quinolinate synthase NadA [Armatimonadetes bacterium]|nr:quinolinate synthase NadA [Armatimonadota bacterium]